MKYHKACRECVLNHDCSFQDNNEVENCEDVQAFDEDEDFEEEEE